MAKKTRVLSWNINGIRAAVKKGFIKYLVSQNPDIFCLQETKAQPEQLGEEVISPQGYHTYWNYPTEKKGYSGVGLFTREKPSRISLGIGIKEFDDEGRILIAEYSHFILFNVYFPKGDTQPARIHRLEYKLAFYDAFLEYVNAVISRNDRIIICGDLNTAHKPIDLARPKENEKTSGFRPEERAWIDKLIAHGFVDSFRQFNTEPNQYTWWDMKTRARERNIGWRLDYFFVSRKLMPSVERAFILDNVKSILNADASDHCPVGVDLKLA